MDEQTIRPSVLGTKEYWETLYQGELNNYLDHQNPGEVWFGRNLVVKIVKWIKDNLQSSSTQPSLLDVGCGNGHLLYSLYQSGFTDLTGLDYASKSIQLVEKMCFDNGINCCKLLVADILTLSKEKPFPEETKFDCIIDKGTFDAICLNPDIDLNQVKEDYLATIDYLLRSSGFFLLASCNWTKQELINMFTGQPSSFLDVHDEIQTSQFSFGGQKGNTVTCLIFKRSCKD